jgi:hypothetical protein
MRPPPFSQRLTRKLLAVALAAQCALPALAKTEGLWTYRVETPVPPRGDQPQPPAIAHLWLPDDVKKVRGLFYPGAIIIGEKLAKDPVVRATLAAQDMGVLFFKPGLGANFIRGAGDRLEQTLAELARQSGRPEVEFAPLLTAGHSADGISARNVAYWKPQRVIGVLLLKSGNFHHGIEDLSRSLAGVPLCMISGEFEEYGPEGGDPALGVGLRAEYSLHPVDKKKQNQTQWVMARMQMLGRRQKHPDNLWSLIVHRGKGHTAWDNEMRDLVCLFIRSCADARIPKTLPDGTTEVRCRPLTARDGWLYDADIKNPRHGPAPYNEYTGNPHHAFWVPDKTLALAITEYHNRGWPVPDPTASDPPEKRFWPPPLLADLVDAPAPTPLTWKGGNGAWSPTGPAWLEAGRAVAWDDSRQAVFAGKPGVVTLAANLTCHGLQLGPGYTLDIANHSLRVRWHTALAEDSTVIVRVITDPDTARARAGRLILEGNARLAGTLRVEPTGEFPRGGTFNILSIAGLKQGDFARVALPDGWELKHDRRGWSVIVPRPGAARN